MVPWLYEQHAVPALGEGAQSMIKKQVLDRADLVLAFFDARLGTETPDAVSGTAEEIQRAAEAGKPVHVYFSTEDVTRDALDVEQLAGLERFRANLLSQGLLGEYSSPLELGTKILQAIDYDVATNVWTLASSQPKAPHTVQWRLAHRVGDSFVAENVGDGTAFSARVRAFADLHVVRTHEEPETIGPGEALTFMAVPVLATRDDRVLVTWTEDGSNEDKTWKYPLPGRPR